MHIPHFIVCPTTGLRKSLSASIAGLVENAAAYGHRPAVLISADSPNKEAKSRVFAALKDIDSTFGFTVLSVLPAQRISFFYSLKKQFDPDLMKYATAPFAGYSSFGANLNSLLIATAGSSLVSNDDDVFCRPGVSKQYEQTVLFSDNYLPADLFYYPDRKSLLNAISEISVDVLSEHGRFIGENSANIKGVTADDSTSKEITILMCIAGSYGESGMKSSRSFLSSETPSREKSFKSSEIYNAYKLSKEVIRIPEFNTVGQGTHCIAMHICLSNDRILPPFLPAGRNQEGLFSVLLRICYPDSCTAFLNFGLYHNPEKNRVHTREDLVEFHPNLAELIMALIISHRPSKEITNPMARMVIIGKTLGEIGSQRINDFEEFLHSTWSRGINMYVQHLLELLDKYHMKPKAWAKDVDEHLEYVYTLLREPHLLFGKTGCGFSAEEVRYHTLMYGKLLQIWPELHAKSAELNRESRGLAKPLPA